jgi:hypothetical protein
MSADPIPTQASAVLPLIDATRFWAKVDQSGGPDACWPWLSTVNESGYPQYCPYVRSFGRSFSTVAYRVAYWLAYGSLPVQLSHTGQCLNEICCNPKHLIPADEKLRRAIWRERVPKGEKHYRTKLTASKVNEIRRRYANGEQQQTLADEYQMTQQNVHLIISNQSWLGA